jgi:hypothetical protein
MSRTKEMRFILALLLAMLSSSAHSAQRFSFAGLTWGDSVKTADEKLRAAGHSGLVPDTRFDNIMPAEEHLLRFTGQIADHPFEADATFVGDKLIDVRIGISEARPHQNAEEDIQRLLVTRYGKPRERGANRSFEKFWQSGSGDELTLRRVERRGWNGDSSLQLSYMSLEALRRASARGAAHAAEVRRDAKAAEAAARAKATGL